MDGKREQLRMAAGEGDLSRVQELWLLYLDADNNANNNVKWSNGWTPALHLVCRTGDLEIAKWLVEERGANVHAKTNSGKTPLHEACAHGRLEVVKWLVEERWADVYVNINSGQTPLHEACTNGRFEVVNWLFKCKRLQAIRDEFQTPLHLACSVGHLELVKRLVRLGADALAKDIRGNTPLHQACFAKNYSGSGHLEIVKWLVGESVDANIKNKKGATPLHGACNVGHLELVKWLVEERGADVYAKTNNGQTPLHEAWTNGRFEVVKWLMNQAIRNDIQTPLHLAGNVGHLELVKWLVRFGADDIRGNTALLHQTGFAENYSGSGHLEIVKWLVGKSVDANIKNEKGATPLHGACNVGHLELVKWLVEERGADVYAKTNNGQTPLHEACTNRRLEVVKWLMKRERLQAASMLECALWKSKLQEQAANTIVETGTTEDVPLVVKDEDRSLCRSLCGADVVVVNVISFLSPTMLPPYFRRCKRSGRSRRCRRRRAKCGESIVDPRMA